MTELTKQRIKRDAQMLALLKDGRSTYVEIAAELGTCVDVVIRVARKNGLQRGPGGRKLAVTNA